MKKTVSISFLSVYCYRVHVCISVRIQMCVDVPQLTGEWKLFPADVSSLPAVCTSSSPTISSTGKRSVIVTINNIPPFPHPLVYFHLAVLACFVQLSVHEDLLLYISFKNPFKSTPPYVQAEEWWFSRYISSCMCRDFARISTSWRRSMCGNISWWPIYSGQCIHVLICLD